jgi:hypothetical protein
MQKKIPLNYESTPSRRPARSSPAWMAVRLIVAVPLACWGFVMVLGGLNAMLGGELHYVAMFLWGVALLATAAAALKLPTRR